MTHSVELDLKGNERSVGETNTEVAEVDIPAVFTFVYLEKRGVRLCTKGNEYRTWKKLVTGGISVPLLVVLKSPKEVGLALVERNASTVARV
jgi:hypothetical protein